MFKSRVILNTVDAEWILLIHGFGGSSNTWQKQIDTYSQNYNLLLLDMHDNSDLAGVESQLTMEGVCRKIAAVMDYHEVPRAHLLGLSLGTMIALAFAVQYPHRVMSMLLAGGIIRFDFKSQILLWLALLLKNKVAYIKLYSFFAFVIMPRKNHKQSRDIFLREAQKLGPEEFCKWLDLLYLIKNSEHLIDKLNNLLPNIKILYVMGSEDHLFKSKIIHYATQLKSAQVRIIPGCGHVCTIEKDQEFTEISMAFWNECQEKSSRNLIWQAI